MQKQTNFTDNLVEHLEIEYYLKKYFCHHKSKNYPDNVKGKKMPFSIDQKGISLAKHVDVAMVTHTHWPRHVYPAYQRFVFIKYACTDYYLGNYIFQSHLN